MKKYIKEFGDGKHFSFSVIEFGKNDYSVAILTSDIFGEKWEISTDIMVEIFGTSDLDGLSSMEVYGIYREVSDYLFNKFPVFMGVPFEEGY